MIDEWEFNRQLGRRLREAREAKGYTVASFARLLCVSATTWERIESGQVAINVQLLVLAGRAAGRSIQRIVDGLELSGRRRLLSRSAGISRGGRRSPEQLGGPTEGKWEG